MRHAFRFVCPLLASIAAFAATPTVGAPAPEIALDRLLPNESVAKATLKALAGKSVVLEFWSTWCSGCISAITHLNQLAAEFQRQPVVFLSVTNEAPDVIENFVQRHPIEGWVGIAARSRLFQSYGVEALPRTFLIDASGRIAAVSTPDKLTAAMLTDLIAGRPVDAPRPPASVRGGAETPAAPPLLDMVIRPTADSAVGRGKLAGTRRTLRSILSQVYRIYPEERVEGEPVEDKTAYDFSFSLPGATNDEFQELAQQLVCAAFQVKAARVQRETEALALTAPNGRPAGFVPNNDGGSIASFGRAGKFRIVNGGPLSLALFLRRQLNKEVVDETGLTGRYNFELSWEAGSTESLLEAVRKQLGLNIEPRRRSIEFLRVTRVQ